MDSDVCILKSSVSEEAVQRKKEFEKQLLNSKYGILTINAYHTIEPAPIVPVSRVKCEYCGSKILSDLVNCPNCGAPL